MARLRRCAHGASAVVTLGLVASMVIAWADPAGAVTVTDETTLRAAWSNPAETRIDLAADITLTCDGGGTGRKSTIPLTLDGHGHSITQTCANSLALVVLNDASGGGASSVTLRNVTMNRGNATLPAALTNSKISGNESSTVGPGVSQLITVQVRKARHHRPRRHRSRPGPAAPAPVAPVQAVVRFTG